MIKCRYPVSELNVWNGAVPVFSHHTPKLIRFQSVSFPVKGIHHGALGMNPHLQSSYSNEESQSQSQITDSEEDFEPFRFANSPNSKLWIEFD